MSLRVIGELCFTVLHYTLAVNTKGLVITLLVNDVPVGQATLTTFPSGAVGLRGINDCEVLFQQLSIVEV